MNALAGILIEWQVGVKEFRMSMKTAKNRRNYVEDFVNNSKFNIHLRDFVRQLMLQDDSLMDGEAARLKLLELFGSTEEGERIKY